MAISAPTDISNLATWLDASHAASFTLSGTVVTGWTDRGGSGRNVHDIQNSPNRNVTINGLSAVNMGTTAWFFIDLGMTAASATSAEAFVVIKRNSTPGSTWDGTGLWHTFGSGAGTHYPNNTGDSLHIYDDFGSNTRTGAPYSGVTFTNAHIYGVAAGAADWTVYLDGVSLYTRASNTFSISGTDIYVGRNAADNNFDGVLGELVVYHRKLTTGERSDVVDYLTAKWITAGATYVRPQINVSKQAVHRASRW